MTHGAAEHENDDATTATSKSDIFLVIFLVDQHEQRTALLASVVFG